MLYYYLLILKYRFPSLFTNDRTDGNIELLFVVVSPDRFKSIIKPELESDICSVVMNMTVIEGVSNGEDLCFDTCIG